jgi:hypothetical protein
MKWVSSALCIALAAGFAAAAPTQQAPRSTARTQKTHKKPRASQALATTAMYGPPAEAAVQPPPPTPAQMPPVPANVAFQNGLLTIAAENSTLADVLAQVRAKTGASIDIPPSAGAQRVVIHAGPLPPREALLALLTGSGFDYVIVGSDQDPESVQRVILTPHQAGARAANVTPLPPTQPPRPSTGDPDVDDSAGGEIVTQPATPPPVSVPPRPMPPPPATTGTQPQPNGDQQPQVKTPQQLLEELQRLQQQRQQQQQNQQNPQVPQVPR